MTYEELKDRINFLGAKAPGLTKDEEQELIKLLKKRETYQEYQEEQRKQGFFLNLLRR